MRRDGCAGGRLTSMSPRRSLLSPLLDAMCLALFVGIGRESHGIGRGAGWFFTVFWPFAVGWFVVAALAGLYTATGRPWARLAVTWIAGIALSLMLRDAITHRGSFNTFAVVVYVFVGLAVFGWRALANALRRLRPVARS